MSESLPPHPPVPVRRSRDGSVTIIRIDNPPVNALSRAVRAGLLDALREAVADPTASAIVLCGAKGCFAGGADIREFDGPSLDPSLPEVCAAIAGSPKPVVAAVEGHALGGGCELALASHARVLAENARMALPEVKLGLIPGAGGTQRLLRLVDAATALDIIASGRFLAAAEAQGLGLADDVVPARDVVATAARRALARAGAAPTLSEQPVRVGDVEVFRSLAARVRARARGQRSPVAAAELLEASLGLSFAEGLALERSTFLELRASDQAAALRHVFFAERRSAEVPGIDRSQARDVTRVGVIGAGTMGTGIAAALLGGGYTVRVVEPDAGVRRRAPERIAEAARRAARASGAPVDLAGLTVGDGIACLADCDLVVEAVFEDADLKTAVLRFVVDATPDGTIVATNTSYLDVDRLAAATGRPDRVVGLHFFAPAEVMRLVEVVRGASSSATAVATAFAVARRVGKLPIVAGVCDGFIANRIMASYRREMEYALEDGALPHEIDAAFEAYGFPMGPFAVADLSGLDIAWARRRRLAASRDPHERYVPVADWLCEAGRFGRKSGAGWYRYVDGKPMRDDVTERLIKGASSVRGIARSPIPADRIMQRALAAMVEEAASILREGVALRASDIDLAMIHGFGFPAWRGGPLFESGRFGAAAPADRTASADP